MRQRGRMLRNVAFLILSLAVLDACRDVLEPSARGPGAVAKQVVAPEQGCGRFELSVTPQLRWAVSAVDTTLTATCGSLRIRVVDAKRDPQHPFNLRLSVVLENAGQRSVKAPALLYGWDDSLDVKHPRLIARSRHESRFLHLIDPDSTVPATAPGFPGAFVWKLDTLLAAQGAPQVLPAGASSSPRLVDVRVVFGVLRFSITLRATATGASVPVPDVPPDGIPDEFFSDAAQVTNPALWSGAFMRDIILIRFRPDATQADKQAAVDALSGTVVGGVRVTETDGVYVVQLPADPTNTRPFTAMAQANAMPRVSWSIVNTKYVGAITYLRPTDGAGMTRSDWRTDPAAAFGNAARRTWALEAVNAPLAWGCTVGGATRVGVLDMGIHAAGDIVPNIAPGIPALPADTFTHGTAVASVIAARGNDSTGITGIMWRAQLDLREVSQRLTPGGAPRVNVNMVNGQPRESQVFWETGFYNSVAQLLGNAVRVINVSLGDDQTPVSTTPAAQAARRAAIGHMFAEEMRGRPAHQHPLWVISAGNQGHTVSADYSTLTAIADSVPAEALVVTGAGATAGQLAPDVSGLGNIHIAAPGESVTVMDAGGVHALSGSSFATPLVAGAAGLLFSFDSTLTPAQVRDYLITGARRGGRVAGTYPVLDAYRSLRLAAARPGAPICGNRIFLDSTAHVIVERRTSDTTFTDDAIAGGDFSTVPLLDVWLGQSSHDSHFMDVFGDGEWTLAHRNGLWQREPRNRDSSEARVVSRAGPAGGTAGGSSHDRDTVLVLEQRRIQPFSFTVRLNVNGVNTAPLITMPGVVTGSAYPLNGREILLAVASNFDFFTAQQIVAFNFVSGATRSLSTRPPGDGSLNIFLSQSEQGDEFVMQYTRFDQIQRVFNRCRSEYRSMQNGALLREFEQPFPRSAGACSARSHSHSTLRVAGGGSSAAVPDTAQTPRTQRARTRSIWR